MISIIAAMDKKRGIGKDGSIPWNIPEDFRHFKEITTGHPVIMGRRTFESIGKILLGRANIIVSRNLDDKSMAGDLNWASSLEDAIKLAEKIEREATPLRPNSAKASSGKQGSEGQGEIFIIGGGEIYKQALENDLVDKMYLTIIEAHLDSPSSSSVRQGDFEADTFFPEYSGFKEIKSEEKESDKYKFTFLELRK